MQQTDQAAKPSKLTIWLLFAVLTLIWGASFLFIKNGLVAFTTLQVGVMRIAVAFLVLLPLSFRIIAKTPRSLLFPFFLSGLLGNLLPSILFATAGQHLPSSISGCLNAFTPIFTMLVGLLIYKQPLKVWQVVGLSIGMCGAVLIASRKGINLADFNPYAGLVLLATISYALNVNFLKYKLAGYPPEQNAIMALTLAGFPAFAWLCFDQDFISRLQVVGLMHQSVLSILVLGVFGSAVGTLLFNRMIKMTTAVFASSVTYAIPIVSVVIGLLINEPFGLIQASGMLFILGGVYLVNLKK